jgi:hypothetical protein
MNKFYNYDTRGASAASQIINLERMVQERDTEIERLRSRLAISIDYVDGIPTGYGEDEIDRQQAEIERLRGELIKERLLVRHIDQVDAALAANLGQEIKRLRSFAEWILEAYDSDEWPAQKDIVAGAREALSNE